MQRRLAREPRMRLTLRGRAQDDAPTGAVRGGAAMTELSSIDALRRQKLDRIATLTRILARPIERESLLDEVVAAAKDLCDAEGAAVWWYYETTHELDVHLHGGAASIRISADSGIIGECLRTRAPVIVPDAAVDGRLDRSIDLSTGCRTRCLLALPLIGFHEPPVGVLLVVNTADGVFDADDVAIAGVLAAQCAVCLQRTQLVDRLVQSEKVSQEIEVAREVQMGTLPKSAPDIAGYDLAGTFRPADQTGGDTYDFVPTADGGVMVLMGDATGHGIGPALSATQVRAMLRVAQRLDAGLDDTFRHINDQLVVDLPDDRFVTAFLGHIDPATHVLRYHSGGQGPLLHFHAADGSCDTHVATTAPLGAMPQAALGEPRTVELAPGDVFALLSDGVYEYCDIDGREFGEQAVADLLRRHHDEPMAELRDRVLRALADFGRGAPQLDDISIVLIRRLAGPPRKPFVTRREFARSFDSLDDMFAFVRGVLDGRNVGEADRYAIVLAIEELFTNMVKYNAKGSGNIEIELACNAAEVTCRLTDPDSERFDVTAAPDADIRLPVEKRVPGGLGIHLVRRLVDSIDYDYLGRRSRVTFRKAIAKAGSTQAQAPPEAPAGGLDQQQLPCSVPENQGEATMFEISFGPGGIITFAGRLDAAQCARAQEFIEAATVLEAFDFSALEYISSAGLGVLLKTHKRLIASGSRLRLVNVSSHIYDIFRFSGFDKVFDVERAAR